MTEKAPTKTTRRKKAPAEEAPEAQAPAEEAPEAKPEKPGMVEVNNIGRFDYVQPATGIRIHAGARGVLMLDDTWLDLQCGAKILEKV